MDLLRTAVVDVTTLVATCHALKSRPAEDGEELQRKLRRDIKRGTVAYIDTLARTRRGVVDDGLLAKCRIAAERQLARALAHQELLNGILTSEAGALDGLAAARQDLWRLAHVATRPARSRRSRRASWSWPSARTSCVRCACSRTQPTTQAQAS